MLKALYPLLTCYEPQRDEGIRKATFSRGVGGVGSASRVPRAMRRSGWAGRNAASGHSDREMAFGGGPEGTARTADCARPLKYRFFIADDALPAYGAATSREQAQLEDYFRHIADFPENFDCTWDVRGFDFFAKRFGRWNVTYQIDGAVKRVFIIGIKRIPK